MPRRPSRTAHGPLRTANHDARKSSLPTRTHRSPVDVRGDQDVELSARGPRALLGAPLRRLAGVLIRVLPRPWACGWLVAVKSYDMEVCKNVE